MEPHTISRPLVHRAHDLKGGQETTLMDVDFALSELNDLRSATEAVLRPKSSGGGGGDPVDPRPERKPRVRSLSESMATSSRGPAQSHSESCLHRPLDGGGVRGSLHHQPPHSHHQHHHHRKPCSMGSKMIGCSLSLPRKIGGYHVVQRNAAFVSDISATGHRSPLEHSASLPSRWDSGLGGGYSDQSSSESPPPPSMGHYRDSDLLEDKSRQRRLARVRLVRSRRLRQPYSVPLRMCQSMNEESVSTLSDFLKDGAGSSSSSLSRVSKSTTASPVKQDSEAGACTASGGGALVRSRSIDNLELAKLRLSDVLGAKPTASSSAQEAVELEQVASDLKNLQVV